METVRILEVKQSVFANNDAQADKLRQELKEKGIYLLNLMSSPGSGKTTTLTRLIAALQDDLKIGVMEADIDSDVDAKTIAATGAKAIQLHTGGMCHLDAAMTRQGLEGLDSNHADLVILENVGNLVCPAEFNIGESARLAILSIPEGDDKVAKYPLMFSTTDALALNKYDMLPYFDFDTVRVENDARDVNPDVEIYPVSTRSGEGLDDLVEWVKRVIAG